MTILAKSLKSLRLCQVEYLPSKQGVAGSSPAGAAKTSRKSTVLAE